jgi:2-iminobutanoate/2-iminopropanoate deaminase
MKKIIHTDHAPKAVGPYSQAVEANGTLYVSGQIPVDPATGRIPETIEDQTEQALKNVGAILEAAGYARTDVVKSTVLLADMGDFAAMNAVYARFYTHELPARAAYQVAALPLGVKVEIETIAVKQLSASDLG